MKCDVNLSKIQLSFIFTRTETFVKKGWKIYPNPATTYLSVETSEVAEITITDMTGKLLSRELLKSGPNSINVETLSSGIYTISSASGVHMKFVKQ